MDAAGLFGWRKFAGDVSRAVRWDERCCFNAFGVSGIAVHFGDQRLVDISVVNLRKLPALSVPLLRVAPVLDHYVQSRRAFQDPNLKLC